MTTPRISDDDVLQWVRLRTRGLSSKAIARQFGVAPEHVRTATTKVRNADAAESGEDVSGAYW